MTAVYPQAHPFAEGDLEEFLAQPLVAKLCTHNEDGSIHVAPIWFNNEDGEILLGTQEVTQKVHNIMRDSNVTVLVDKSDPPVKAVIVVGIAELDYEDAVAKRTAIFGKYIDNPAELAQNLASSWTPVIIRVKPQSVTTFDYSQGFGIGSESGQLDI